MKKLLSYIVVSLIVISSLPAQTIQLTLDECQSKARDNYPLIKQYGLISRSEKFNLENAGKSYLPQVTLNAQATYQSDVTKLPIDISQFGMDIPSMSKDQYKATIDINQVIWDGGQTSAQQGIIKANTAVEQQSLEVNLYQIRDRVNQLYFGILSIDKQIAILKLNTESLNTTLDFVNASFRNGTAMQSDIDAIQVEILNIEQQTTELKASRKSYTDMLSVFIKQEITPEHQLTTPNSAIVAEQNNRPELFYYNKQLELLNKQETAISAKNMPNIGLFTQGGYGRPGLNMLEDQFKLFAIGGVKLTWKFGNLYTKKNEQRLIETQRQLVNIQEETFLFNNTMESSQTSNEIQKYKNLLEKDTQIIALRERVKNASDSKYRNGIYTINDLIKDINAENQARQTMALHEIQYLYSIYNYNNIKGY
ncbi:TolC family protein [Dysgonomonas macrotermitis]|uniref:Outer membrane protein TolC n=1 Tax=Dysgonomonas macrotermitis TaxID=1346286 RepID=A0A1M4SW65_9BACT|nr:TolC family protein [Dysgonomonas macrotermitis]SHE36277.1 Outer membrane protein TolC [Dysgonomonas macrotermitis]